MNLVLLGPPGAGKGTQGMVLSKKYEIPHISTGDILRGAVKNNTPLGKEAKSYMDKGGLVPDTVVVKIVVDRLKNNDTKKGFILDGFPRTLKQAEELDGSLKKLSIRLDLVIYFRAQKETSIARLTGRRVCKNCGFNYHVKNMPPKRDSICDKCGGEIYQRPDDNLQTVVNRLEVYEKETLPLIDYYRKSGSLMEVSGDLEVGELSNVLSKIFAEKQLA